MNRAPAQGGAETKEINVQSREAEPPVPHKNAAQVAAATRASLRELNMEQLYEDSLSSEKRIPATVGGAEQTVAPHRRSARRRDDSNSEVESHVLESSESPSEQGSVNMCREEYPSGDEREVEYLWEGDRRVRWPPQNAVTADSCRKIP